jgi:YfiH family protein
MIYTSQGQDVPILQFESFSEAAGIQHAVFTRQGGVSAEPFSSLNLSVSVPDKKEDVYANRRRAYGAFGRDTGSLVHAHLVHGASVARVTDENYGTWIDHTDGIITNQRSCALTMNFADCAPIFLFDPANQVIGLGHAGWMGAVRDLPGALVHAMTVEFGSDPAHLLAGIGPAIGPCCYEVSEPVTSQVREKFAAPESLLLNGQKGTPAARDGHFYFDLPEANRRNLQRAGVQQIEMSGLCTACRTDWFFSHRAEEGKTGRFGTIFILD